MWSEIRTEWLLPSMPNDDSPVEIVAGFGLPGICVAEYSEDKEDLDDFDDDDFDDDFDDNFESDFDDDLDEDLDEDEDDDLDEDEDDDLDDDDFADPP